MDELIDADVVEQLRGIAAGRGQRGGARSDWPGLAEATNAVRDQRLRTRVDVVRDAIVSDVGSDFDLLHEVQV